MGRTLRYKEHIANRAERAFKAALAMKRLQGLRASSMRQLFSATFAPAMDYASPAWYLAVPDIRLSMLERAQRIAAQAIVGGIRTMGRNVAVIEAGISTLRQRLHDQTFRFWIGIHKRDDSHMHAKLAKHKSKKRFPSPLRKAAVLFKSIKASRAEMIPAVGCEPWCLRARVRILDKGSSQASYCPGTENAGHLYRRISEER